MDSFSSELGMQFGTCLEAPHVIDIDLQVVTNLSTQERFPELNVRFNASSFQVWAGAISNGPGNYPLNGSYKTADSYSFQVLCKSVDLY